MKFLFWISLPLYALDQLSKWLVVTNIEFESSRTVIPGFFDLVYWGNTGAAFSTFTNSNPAFIVLAIVTLGILAAFSLKGAFRDTITRSALALLVAGIAGNLTDRLVHHHVVDFLLFDLHVPYAHPWPAFNVADSCICTAAALFVIHSFWEERRLKRLKAEG